MRIMGIDYGEKRVGIAISNEENFAIPTIVLLNNKKLLDSIVGLCKTESIGKIIIGESKNYKGEDNPIMKKISKFRSELTKRINLPIIFHPEFMTSVEADRLQGRNSMRDASAASLILKSYIDSNKK